MREGRWTTVAPSQFQHEREALKHIQERLPEAEPYRAWSNFTFTAGTGHVREVDLFVVTHGGLYLIEIKSLHGRLTASGSNWILQGQRGERVFDNPLHLADSKAKQLRSLLSAEAGRLRLGLKIPYIQAAVFLAVPSLRVELPDNQLHRVFGPQPPDGGQPGPLPPIWSGLLEQPPRDDKERIRPELSKALPKLLHGVGIARSRRHFQIGSWELTFPPFDTGPTWQDHLAQHSQIVSERRRIRIYLVERQAGQAERTSIEQAARREMLALHGISHPGIVQVDAMEQHEAGPALIFRHRPDAERLDHYMARFGDRLDAATRIDMIRQLAEAIRYAHGRHLHHRALSARSVFAVPASRRRGGDEVWLSPRLQISDWQAATRSAGSGSATPSVSVRAGAASQVAPHLERSAEGYLAPELSAPDPDPVAMDVFGLGTVSYLLLTGKAPAAQRSELLTRLSGEDGLRPSAAVDSVSELVDGLVQEATRPVPADRLTTVSEFLELLELVEDELTAPTTRSIMPAVDENEDEPDPLEARPGDLVGGEWRIDKRLGTGSTSRAFLATNERTGAQEVLKVALSDEKATRLDHEAQILRKLADSRVIRLSRQEPIRVGERTVLVLEHAGEKTVARKLRDEGRLTVDDLETFSDYLFGAVDYLEGEGVAHRDLKPDNIAIKIRKNRTRQLVLFDFSLAGISVKEIEAGTPRYLDPFLGTPPRPVYDDHAERYALAVTLHEMASGELPFWGDGRTEARYTDGPPMLAVEAFDPAIRDGLAGFLTRALDREASGRFATLKEMRDAWQQVFRTSDAAVPVGTDHPIGTEPEDDQAAGKARDTAAAKATRSTLLESAGLTPRAISAAHELNATTVADLLELNSKQIIGQPGLGAKTRRELQRRIREWKTLLGGNPAPAQPADEMGTSAHHEGMDVPGDGTSAVLARVGVDGVVARLLPALARNGRNATEVEATRLLLGLPDRDGVLSGLPPWPRQQLVAEKLGVSSGRVAQVLSKQRREWHGEPVVRSVHAELVELLADGGRVMGMSELAAAVLARRGSVTSGEDLRRAVAGAAVRAAVEIDALADESRLLIRRHGNVLLVALEVTEEDGPRTPSAPALLDHADALGRVADRLAGLEVLPAPATVLRELTAVRATSLSLGPDDQDGSDAPDWSDVPDGHDRPDAPDRPDRRDRRDRPGHAAGEGMILDERRLVRLAAAASQNAAATARMEIYPRDLDPVRALRIAQAGLITPHPDPARSQRLTVEAIRERVRARFPDLEPLPEHPKLDRLLREAGFEVRWSDGGYVLPPGLLSSTGMFSSVPVTTRRTTARGISRYTADSPEQAAAVVAEQRLTSAAGTDGFRALTVRRNRYTLARDELAGRFGAQPVNIAALFLAALHDQVDPRPKPTWATVLAADVAEPGSRAARKISEYAAAAWAVVEPRLVAMVGADLVGADLAGADPVGGTGPLLLHDAGPLARYRGMDVLYAVAGRSRSRGRPTWLLCPVDDPGHPPRLDGELVQVVTENEWIMLPDAWVANEHRSGEKAS